MGLGFLAFGVTMILRPENVRDNFDRFANSWKQDSWHPYKLRLAGALTIACAAVFFGLAYVGLHR